jgi:hypothetical protein
MLVEDFGDVGILERFALHDMAPMARGVTDGQKHRFVFGARLFEGAVAPREPVYGIVGVLLQVGAFLMNERIRHRVGISLKFSGWDSLL